MDTFYVVTKTSYGNTFPFFINAKDAAAAKRDAADSKVTKKVVSVQRVTKRSLTAEMFRLLLNVRYDDAQDALESVADAMLAAGMTKEATVPSIKTAAKLLLQVAAWDINLKVPTKLLDAEAVLIAQKIVDAVEVTDPALVPPVSKRRGMLAGVAEKAA